MSGSTRRPVGSLVLYDGYVIPLAGRGAQWRRTPTVDEIKQGLQQRRGPLRSRSLALANNLKVLAFLYPKALVYPYWALNNPLLLYLGSLHISDKACVRPAFEGGFLQTYWGARPKHRLRDLVYGLYPADGRPTLPPNGSWLHETYHGPLQGDAFERLLRDSLDVYANRCLARLDSTYEPLMNPVLEDPRAAMTKRVVKLAEEGPVGELPPGTTTDEVRRLLADLAERFDIGDRMFDMTTALRRWKEMAKERGYGAVLADPNWFDWLIRDEIYLPGHRQAMAAVAAGYSSASLLSELDGASEEEIRFFGEAEGERYLLIDGSYQQVVEGAVRQGFADVLADVRLSWIFDEVRGTKWHNAHLDRMDAAAAIEAPGERVNAILDTVCILMSDAAPAFRRYFKQEGLSCPSCFKDEGLWKLRGWEMDHPSGAAAVIGTTAAVASGVIGEVLGLELPLVLFWVPLALAGLSGGASGPLTRRVSQRDQLKAARGRPMMLDVLDGVGARRLGASLSR